MTGLITGAIEQRLRSRRNERPTRHHRRTPSTSRRTRLRWPGCSAGRPSGCSLAALLRRHAVAADRRPSPRRRTCSTSPATSPSSPSSRIGMTAVIITGGIDLSVGSTVLISAMVDRRHHACRAAHRAGDSGRASSPRCWSALINGVLIAYVGMPAFVVTLGMLSIARSIAMVMSNNAMIYQFGPDQAILFALGGGSSPVRPADPQPGDRAGRCWADHRLRAALDPLGPAPLSPSAATSRRRS